jgi:uncharacterized protein (DUF983 family)
MTTPSAPRRSLIWSLLRQRCPSCREGRMFSGVWHMNDPCPTCGKLFQREEGYFLGAMYFSYALATFVLLPLYGVVFLLLPGSDTLIIALVATGLFLPLVPVVFRYSRVLWVYVDELVSPGASSAAPYEKVRREQIQRH